MYLLNIDHILLQRTNVANARECGIFDTCHERKKTRIKIVLYMGKLKSG